MCGNCNCICTYGIHAYIHMYKKLKDYRFYLGRGRELGVFSIYVHMTHRRAFLKIFII